MSLDICCFLVDWSIYLTTSYYQMFKLDELEKRTDVALRRLFNRFSKSICFFFFLRAMLREESKEKRKERTSFFCLFLAAMVLRSFFFFARTGLRHPFRDVAWKESGKKKPQVLVVVGLHHITSVFHNVYANITNTYRTTHLYYII